MEITHADRGRFHAQPTTIVWAAVAILIVVAILAFGAMWAAGIWPVTASQNSIVQGIDADSSRYMALGRQYAARGAEADAARWAALARSYASDTTANRALDANPELVLARRTYVAANGLASNPELMLARRAYVAANGLASNPELMLARRAYGVGNELASNPELMFARRAYGVPGVLAGSPELGTCSLDC